MGPNFQFFLCRYLAMKLACSLRALRQTCGNGKFLSTAGASLIKVFLLRLHITPLRDTSSRC